MLRAKLPKHSWLGNGRRVSTDLPDDLVDSMTDVKLALEDVVFILQAAGQIKS